MRKRAEFRTRRAESLVATMVANMSKESQDALLNDIVN